VRCVRGGSSCWRRRRWGWFRSAGLVSWWDFAVSAKVYSTGLSLGRPIKSPVRYGSLSKSRETICSFNRATKTLNTTPFQLRFDQCCISMI